MIGCAKFILVYEWTFEYLRRTYGPGAVQRYWEECISVDSQQHARELIIPRGLDGMEEYWGHTLAEEEAGYTSVRTEGAFRIDMFACPSQGALRECGQHNFADYCQHCIGWILPVMQEAGFAIYHEHDHDCRCWWEMVPLSAAAGPSAPGELAGPDDIRLNPEWGQGEVDRFVGDRWEA
jgi:hypothetical protein